MKKQPAKSTKPVTLTKTSLVQVRGGGTTPPACDGSGKDAAFVINGNNQE